MCGWSRNQLGKSTERKNIEMRLLENPPFRIFSDIRCRFCSSLSKASDQTGLIDAQWSAVPIYLRLKELPGCGILIFKTE
jgi:hypothetical protein